MSVSVTTRTDALSVEAVEHRRAFREYVLNEAEPWHRQHLARLYALWDQWNERFYRAALEPPYLLLAEPSNPRRLGDCALWSGFGGRSQIRIRPSLLTGTHPRSGRSGRRPRSGSSSPPTCCCTSRSTSSTRRSPAGATTPTTGTARRSPRPRTGSAPISGCRRSAPARSAALTAIGLAALSGPTTCVRLTSTGTRTASRPEPAVSQLMGTLTGSFAVRSSSRPINWLRLSNASAEAEIDRLIDDLPAVCRWRPHSEYPAVPMDEVGPRALKQPGSPEWCRQTVAYLRRRMVHVESDWRQADEVLDETRPGARLGEDSRGQAIRELGRDAQGGDQPSAPTGGVLVLFDDRARVGMEAPAS